jgi:hypothetical protein
MRSLQVLHPDRLNRAEQAAAFLMDLHAFLDPELWVKLSTFRADVLVALEDMATANERQACIEAPRQLRTPEPQNVVYLPDRQRF